MVEYSAVVDGSSDRIAACRYFTLIRAMYFCGYLGLRTEKPASGTGLPGDTIESTPMPRRDLIDRVRVWEPAAVRALDCLSGTALHDCGARGKLVCGMLSLCDSIPNAKLQKPKITSLESNTALHNLAQKEARSLESHTDLLPASFKHHPSITIRTTAFFCVTSTPPATLRSIHPKSKSTEHQLPKLCPPRPMESLSMGLPTAIQSQQHRMERKMRQLPTIQLLPPPARKSSLQRS